MSALRRLTSSFRSERRSEQACPYSRPQPSPKPKPTRRPRYWDFFNFFSFLAPYSDEEEEEAKKEAEAKAKANQQAEVIVVPEQDSEMSDASVSASSTEESTTTTSDSSLETVETTETAEPVEPVEPPKPSQLAEPARIAEPEEVAKPTRRVEPVERVIPASHSQFVGPTNNVPSQPPVSSTSSLPMPTRSNQPIASSSVVSNPAVETVPHYSNDDELLEWAQQKAAKGGYITGVEFLAIKSFFENRRKDREYEPIKLRFLPRETSPPTISRLSDPSPDAALSHHSAFSSSNSLPTFKNNVPSRPPRMLKVDPNGPLELRGAGSARIKPEAGGKRPVPLVKLRFDPYKRRRLFEEARGPTTKANGVTSHNIPIDTSVTGGTAGPSRVVPRRQHVTPHSPSPLRNVIAGSPSSSPVPQVRTIPTNLSATSSRSTPANQTASAAFLQEAMEKVTPLRPRYSDVVNPYQTASHVKPIVKPMDKKRMSERRARTKEMEKQRDGVNMKQAEKRELTAKEIIEATVPKGAKRSRPPPGLAKARPVGVAAPGAANKRVLEEPEEKSAPSKKRRTVTVEEVSEEEDIRSRSFPVRPNVIIESRSPSPEPASAPVPLHTQTLPTREPTPKVFSTKETRPPMVQTVKEASIKASPAKESCSRVSSIKEQTPKVQPTPRVSSKESSARASSKGSFAKGPSNHFSPLLNSKVTGKSSVPREPSKLRTSFLPDECENEEPKMASPTPFATVTMTTPGTPLADIQEKKDPKEVALTLPLNDLPSFIFKTPPALLAGDHTDARVAAKELPVTSLPKFDFSKAKTAMNGVIFPAVPIPTIKLFDFESAGVKPKVSSGNGQWQCPTCMLQNPASAVEKCSICEAPRPGVEESKKTAVNGIKGVNGVKDLSYVNGKVPSTKSSSASTTFPAVKTFDFAASGLTPETPVSIGQWTCSTCTLQNPAAAEKCIVCGSPRSGAEKMENLAKPKKPVVNGTAHSSKNLTNGIAPPTVKSFDFTAAGLAPKTPVANGNWHCPICLLQNPATALEKCKVCDSPRPGMEKRATQLAVVPIKSIPQLVSKSFDWAGAGLVPKFNGSFWTCGTCMLSNPPTETEKCKVCDASRS